MSVKVFCFQCVLKGTQTLVVVDWTQQDWSSWQWWMDTFTDVGLHPLTVSLSLCPPGPQSDQPCPPQRPSSGRKQHLVSAEPHWQLAPPTAASLCSSKQVDSTGPDTVTESWKLSKSCGNNWWQHTVPAFFFCYCLLIVMVAAGELWTLLTTTTVFVTIPFSLYRITVLSSMSDFISLAKLDLQFNCISGNTVRIRHKNKNKTQIT